MSKETGRRKRLKSASKDETCSCSSLCCLLFFLLEQSEVLVQFGLNLLHPLICVFGGGVKLLLQQAQTDVGLTQLLALRERGAAMLITPPLFLIL